MLTFLKQPSWTLQTMQAILLTEIFTRFRGRKTNVRLSRHFDALFLRVSSHCFGQKCFTNSIQLLDDQGQPTFVEQSPGDARSADSLLDQFGTPSNMRTVQPHDAQIEWDQWREAEARRRLLSSVWFFDWWQATYHQQPRSKAAAEETRSLLCLPCPDTVWDAGTEAEWSAQRRQTGYYVPQPLQMVEQNVSMYNLDTSTFTESLLFCWFVSLLPAREQIPPNNQPNIHSPTPILPFIIHHSMTYYPSRAIPGSSGRRYHRHQCSNPPRLMSRPGAHLPVLLRPPTTPVEFSPIHYPNRAEPHRIIIPKVPPVYLTIGVCTLPP